MWNCHKLRAMTADSHFLPDQRLRLIAAYVAAHRWVTVKQLARDLGVSASTARRDLNRLAEQGFVERLHGGAMRSACHPSIARRTRVTGDQPIGHRTPPTPF
jgi:DeoR/GlpR family transcriptional regulator of sugar metabolism